MARKLFETGYDIQLCFLLLHKTKQYQNGWASYNPGHNILALLNNLAQV